MIDKAIPTEVVRRVLSPFGLDQAHRLPSGFSGAYVARCSSPSGDSFALKRWPTSTLRHRVEEIHRVVQHAAIHGCPFVAQPQAIDQPPGLGRRAGTTLCATGGGLWELSTWQPGQGATLNGSLEAIQAGASAIAQFHDSVTSLGTDRQIAPAVLNRLTRLEERSAQIPSVMESIGRRGLPHELRAVLLDAGHLVRWKWDEVQQRIHRSLSQYLRREVPIQYVLRDVHRDHVLFHEGKISGLIDFDAVRVDTPATDLSRWVGSFLGGNHDAGAVWDAALAGFSARSKSKTGSEAEFEAGMAADLCFASIWISLANWLVWLICEQRSFLTEPTAIASRVQNLVRVASRL